MSQQLQSKHLLLDPDQPLNGILAYIRTIVGISDVTNFVKAKGSKSEPQYNAINLVLGNDSFAGKEPDYNWLEIDFLKGRVWLTNYTWRATALDLFKEFQVLGSDDGHHWDVIDKKETVYEEGNPTRNRMFTCTNPLTRKKIRFDPLTTTHNNNNFFWVHKLEFFGFYFTEKDIPFGKKTNINIISKLLSIITTLLYVFLIY